jgi:hypothetical protein
MLAPTINIAESTKYFWHRYTDLYRGVLSDLEVKNVLKFGVFQGATISWLRERYPDATIVGVDLLPVQPEWPVDERIRYCQLDQGDDLAIDAMYRELNLSFDLIIDDGSHLPTHQAHVLSRSLPYLRTGGLYFLEDIHTSHPHHPYCEKEAPGTATSLAVLLALQHLKEIGQPLDVVTAQRLAAREFFSASEVLALSRRIDNSHLYRRSTLPLRCYACGSKNFDYANYRCLCGADIFLSPDSMTFLLRRSPLP